MDLIGSVATLELLGRDSWPSDACVYQVDERNQILVTDLGNCQAVKIFLTMCNLPYKIVVKENCEFMSPSGEIPFIVLNKFLISDFQQIVAAAAAKGHTLSDHLNEMEKADMKAYISLITNTLTNIELYLTWINKEIYKQVTNSRYGSQYAWPLNYILPLKKQWQVYWKLRSTGWSAKSLEEVITELNTVCQSLSDRLGDKAYFYNDRPTELDALVYGHISALCSVTLLNNQIADVVNKHTNLCNFRNRIDRTFRSHHGDS